MDVQFMSCVQGDNYRKKNKDWHYLWNWTSGYTPVDITYFVFFNLKFQRVITNQQGMVLWKQRESNKTVIEI